MDWFRGIYLYLASRHVLLLDDLVARSAYTINQIRQEQYSIRE